MAAAALRVLGSRLRMNSAAAAKGIVTIADILPKSSPCKHPHMLVQISHCPTVSCPIWNQARAYNQLSKGKNHAVDSPTQTPSSAQVFGENIDMIVEKLWQHTVKRVGDKAWDWVLDRAWSAAYFGLLAVSLGYFKKKDVQNATEGPDEDENSRVLKPVKDLLVIKDRKIKDLEADNRRQKELMETMCKEHDEMQAAIKALEKVISHK